MTMKYDDNEYLNSLRDRIARYNREERETIERCRKEREKFVAEKASQLDISNNFEKILE